VSGRDAELTAFVLKVASYAAPNGSDSVAVLAGLVDEARHLCHVYYLEDAEPLEDEDEDVRLGLTEPDLDECTCHYHADQFDPACPVHGAGAERDPTYVGRVAEPAPVGPGALAYCPALVVVPLEIGRVTHMCTRPAGHAGEHRSDLPGPNGRDRFTWSVGVLAP